MEHEETRPVTMEDVLKLKDRYINWAYETEIHFDYRGDEEEFFRDQQTALDMMNKAGYYAENIVKDLWSPATVWDIVHTDALKRFNVTTKGGVEALRYRAYEP